MGRLLPPLISLFCYFLGIVCDSIRFLLTLFRHLDFLNSQRTLFDQLTAECRCFLNRNLTRFHNLACSVETTLFSQELYNFLFDGFVLFLRLGRLCGSCGITLVELFQLGFGVLNQLFAQVLHGGDCGKEFTISHSIFLSCLFGVGVGRHPFYLSEGFLSPLTSLLYHIQFSLSSLFFNFFIFF